MSRRILVTGSRNWSDVERVALALSHHAECGDVLVHGAADGLDEIAAQMWASFGPVEAYPAAGFADPKVRNLHMIALGASFCLAFASKWGSGTGHCARHARKAGIVTFDYGVSTRIEDRPTGRR